MGRGHKLSAYLLGCQYADSKYPYITYLEFIIVHIEKILSSVIINKFPLHLYNINIIHVCDHAGEKYFISSVNP